MFSLHPRAVKLTMEGVPTTHAMTEWQLQMAGSFF